MPSATARRSGKRQRRPAAANAAGTSRMAMAMQLATQVWPSPWPTVQRLRCSLPSSWWARVGALAMPGAGDACVAACLHDQCTPGIRLPGIGPLVRSSRDGDRDLACCWPGCRRSLQCSAASRRVLCDAGGGAGAGKKSAPAASGWGDALLASTKADAAAATKAAAGARATAVPCPLFAVPCCAADLDAATVSVYLATRRAHELHV